jgi:hypothetical protein
MLVDIRTEFSVITGVGAVGLEEADVLIKLEFA